MVTITQYYYSIIFGWDDFLDIKHIYHKKSLDYEQLYGPVFLKAQEIANALIMK